MWPVSGRFLDALTGTHESVTRVRAFATGPFFSTDPTADPDPRFGVVPYDLDTPPLVSVTGGDVKLTRTGEIRGTAELTVPGQDWELLQPWGATLFIERGIDFGDGTQELVPLGYYRINELGQDQAPAGPLDVTCSDRSVQVMQNRTQRIYQVPDGMTHRALFAWLVNGNLGGGHSTSGSGAYSYRELPITWDADTYDPDVVAVSGQPIVEDGDTWAFLRMIVEREGCALRFDEAGELRIEPLTPTDMTPVYDVRPGRGGNLIRARRSVSNEGVYNLVVAYGTDPAAPVARTNGIFNEMGNPRRWGLSHFGSSIRYLGSPLIRTAPAATAAAQTLVARTARSTVALTLEIVPNPALRPNDVISVDLGDGRPPELRIADDVTIPLTGDEAMTVTTLPLESA